jgi:phospholipid-binding lipoprotein MlaA
MSRWLFRFAAALMVVTASGCATTARDPLEPFNRAMFTVNETVDKAVAKPVATAYKTVTPELVRIGIGNFFDNLLVPTSVVNSLLQGKVGDAAEGVLRFGFNTLFGFAGVLDIATELRLKRSYEDFGQTLGKWGVPPGPYLVLPLLGPTTTRDFAASYAKVGGDPYQYIDEERDKYSLLFLRAVDLRASLLGTERLLDELALDKYTFVRDTYLQRRRNAVYDGDPPEEPDREPVEKPSAEVDKSKDKEQSPPIAPEAPAKPEVAPKSEVVPLVLPDATEVSMAVTGANPSTLEQSQELKISHAAPSLPASNQE